QARTRPDGSLGGSAARQPARAAAGLRQRRLRLRARRLERRAPGVSPQGGAMSASQSITDELRAWIIAQAGAGVSAPALIGAMRKVGWSEDVAVDAIEQVLRSHVDDAARTQGWPPAVPVPEPAL